MMNSITLKAEKANIQEAIAFIDQRLEEVGCSFKAQMQLDVAADEVLANITGYAYNNGEGDMTVTFGHDPDGGIVTLTFEDWGVPFDPLKKTDPDVTLSAEEREVGGLGIFLVKKTMDKVEYRRENDKNILTLVKKI